ncbi:GNS1/SUR4 family protein [Schizosaccharomyces octosporus yFS286]|uniref:Elongation of fatty acids protein n=1 Tax=Schizosaccharomyces octosporus (strain yFS286) TaxID=483514 RepID=S9RAT0_SCHOY|nr:GNS1/SUR4 family protein [Schizosaccharomyces octosporus yFS286]EPX75245.1 GNS1/SUR4 family protein [Schizosaccharomyces octosporus yFS286]
MVLAPRTLSLTGAHMLKIHQPSIDHPFGLDLWYLFEQLSIRTTGWNPSEFEFIPGKTPFSQWSSVIASITLYYVIILGGQAFMKNQKPVKQRRLFQLHNFLLTVVSGGLLALMFEQVFPMYVRHGLYFCVCDSRHFTQKLITLYYLNYMTKYLELLDTVFLFLKKKPLAFLHCYHHGVTALLCFTQLLGRTSVQWVVISLNLYVHVIMYSYYFLAACGRRVWWKQWVTRVQIIQFVIDLVLCYFGTYTHVAYHFFPWLPHAGDCSGSLFAAIFGCGVLSSYLVLFIGFYANTYIKRGARKNAKKAAGKPDDTKTLPSATEEALAATTASNSSPFNARSRKL